MDKYIFFIVCLYLILIWLLIYILRKDLRQKLIKASLMGGLAGLIAEFWYFRDYWRPPSLFGQNVISLEDFLFGFAIVGVLATIFDVILKKKLADGFKKRKWLFYLFFILGVLSLIIFTNWLKFNSIFISFLAFFIFTIIIVIIRKDLLLPSLLSGLLAVAVIIPCYLFLFNFISPDYWGNYWLLYNTSYGIIILNSLPVAELFWYFCLGCLVGINYEFASGKKKV